MSAALLNKLREIYPAASQEGLDQCVALADKYRLDPCSIQLTVYESEYLGRWTAKITRHGYRRIAAAQPGYEGHHYMALYKGDKVAIKGDDILFELACESRIYNDLIGAVGWLYDTGKLHVVRISYSDYVMNKHAWEQGPGKPDYMLQKEAEIAVIQKAYAPLFWDTASEGNEPDEELNLDGQRGDILAYIKDNVALLDDGDKAKPLNRCTVAELTKLKNKIIAKKENS